MRVQETIRQKVTDRLQPQFLDVINESHMHSVPPGSESHFKLVVVSEAFAGQNLLARHRLLNEILARELQEDIHALTLRLFTPDQWQQKGGLVTASPKCRGGTGL